MTEDEIRQAFIGYPGHSNLPIFENENGDWVGYGHFGKTEFIFLCNLIYMKLTDDYETVHIDYSMESEVDHAYAHMLDNEEYTLCASDHPNAFPITVLYI